MPYSHLRGAGLPELLAPGGLLRLWLQRSALGADAVYLAGEDGFGARHYAANFSEEETRLRH